MSNYTESEYIDYLETFISDRLSVAVPEDKPAATDRQVGGDHYASMNIQVIDFIQANDIPFAEGNAIKYLCRHKSKAGAQDLDKAMHYIEIAKNHYYP